MSHYLAAIVLVASLTICVYLLTVLWRIHLIHSSAAWKFIFLGLTLLAVECGVGAHLAYISGRWLSVEQVIFIAIILVKAICYAVGFTIWKHDIDWLKTLAKQRREHAMQDDDEMDDKKPEHPERPEHPLPPVDPPQPGGPIRPQDDPQPPGDPQGPGKGGGGG